MNAEDIKATVVGESYKVETRCVVVYLAGHTAI